MKYSEISSLWYEDNAIKDEFEKMKYLEVKRKKKKETILAAIKVMERINFKSKEKIFKHKNENKNFVIYDQ